MKYCRRKIIIAISGICLLLFQNCREAKDVSIPTPAEVHHAITTVELSEEELQDKILGALVGSAIGDAMGASTEMWKRSDIQSTYGYIDGLTPAIRPQSPEGTWRHDLIAGATTDDTRWKYLMGQYLIKDSRRLSSMRFASFINDYYDQLLDELADKDSPESTDALDEQIEKIDWIKEWARVSKAFVSDETSYHLAKSRFYGGEMSCAGLLYSPMIGLISRSPEDAYTTAYDHSLFDLGYARDITATAAVMTHLSMYGVDFLSVVDSSLMIDPYGYRDSRLIGRLVLTMADECRGMIRSTQYLNFSDTVNLVVPDGYMGTRTEWFIQNTIYSNLESRQKAIAFHAGEIWQILYTSLLYGKADFMKTMTFIINYGRDNDTVAAIAGMILGAKIGYEGLPSELKEQAIKVNKEVIGIDLGKLADQLVKSQIIN